MKYAETITDVRDLLADYEVQVEFREGGTITLQFPLEGDWTGKKFNPEYRNFFKMLMLPEDGFDLA